MIHDAQIEVTCDARCCNSSEYIDLPWCYSDYTGNNGYYNSSDSIIEDALGELEWVVRGQYQFCCKDCYEDSMSEQVLG